MMPSMTLIEPNHAHGDAASVTTQLLERVHDSDTHDLLCVGFGPASLAIAVALHDVMGTSSIVKPTVRFLERQSQFGWHAGMLLPGAKMQISFIKDLATMRDPCSKFTFLNYLKVHNRLAQFVNLNTFLPLRVEFENYLRWVARHFEGVVDYDQEVTKVKPVKNGGGYKYDCFEVTCRNNKNDTETRLFARNVVIAVGGRPFRPQVFPHELKRVIHSSQYQHDIASLLPNKEKTYSVAVVGSGQSAAEVFNDLHSRYPNTKTQLIIRDTSLRPSDDSPFVNEIFDPEMVDRFYQQSHDEKTLSIRNHKATNYSVVRLPLLEKIYEDLYHQSITEPDRALWQHQILPSREIVEVNELPQNKRINLTLKTLNVERTKRKEVLTVDAVILATGYTRDAHIDILHGCQIVNGGVDGEWVGGRDYQVKLDRDLVEEGVDIWLQGCNEATHGLSDTLLSILATRSGELVQAMFGNQAGNGVANGTK